MVRDTPRPTDDDGRSSSRGRDPRDPTSGDDAPPAPDERLTGTLFASPREILTRLSEDRSLRLSVACRRRLAERAILLDPVRLEARTMACVAHHAARHGGHRPSRAWVERRIDESIDALLLEDWEESGRGVLPRHPRDPRYSGLAEALGTSAIEARRVCTLVNGLDEEARRVLYAVFVGAP